MLGTDILEARDATDLKEQAELYGLWPANGWPWHLAAIDGDAVSRADTVGKPDLFPMRNVLKKGIYLLCEELKMQADVRIGFGGVVQTGPYGRPNKMVGYRHKPTIVSTVSTIASDRPGDWHSDVIFGIRLLKGPNPLALKCLVGLPTVIEPFASNDEFKNALKAVATDLETTQQPDITVPYKTQHHNALILTPFVSGFWVLVVLV